MLPAAFGRLCVETLSGSSAGGSGSPAAFGRLCVETDNSRISLGLAFQPPSGGCVLKPSVIHGWGNGYDQPPSGGCVLKQRGRH